MIEITARLVRGSAYIAGETVECCITFSNPQDPNQKKSHSNRSVNFKKCLNFFRSLNFLEKGNNLLKIFQ